MTVNLNKDECFAPFSIEDKVCPSYTCEVRVLGLSQILNYQDFNNYLRDNTSKTYYQR